MIDYWVCLFSGVICATGKQGIFSVLNFICYYAIIIPGAYFFTFKFGTHKPYGSDEEIQGLGLIGIWLSFIIGLQVLLSSLIIMI